MQTDFARFSRFFFVSSSLCVKPSTVKYRIVVA